MATALEPIPGTSPAFRSLAEYVRAFTRDHPQLNRLLRGYESSDNQIAWAIVDAVSKFNGTPHFTGMTLEDLLNQNQRYLMTRMTVIALIESVGLLQTRNHVNYSNGGLNLGVNDKTPMLMNWLQYFRSSTDELMRQVKVAININGILHPGGFHSEYLAINATYVSW